MAPSAPPGPAGYHCIVSGVADAHGGAISRIVWYLVHSILARPSSYRRPPVFSNRAVPYSVSVSVSFLGSSLSLFLCVLVSSHRVCTFITLPTLTSFLFPILLFLLIPCTNRFFFFLVFSHSHHLNEPLISDTDDTRFPHIQTHSHTTTIRIAQRICMYLIHPPHTSHFTHSSIK